MFITNEESHDRSTLVVDYNKIWTRISFVYSSAFYFLKIKKIKKLNSPTVEQIASTKFKSGADHTLIAPR